jgi:small subunit ribosomal protein S8
VSKPGLRVYTRRKEIPMVLNGLGVTILSTPQGVMTGRDAFGKNLGGEVVAYVW